MLITIAFFFARILLCVNDATAYDKSIFLDKLLLLEELSPEQIALVFPITWYFNVTDVVRDTANVPPSRIRRRADWGRTATASAGAAVGALGGAISGTIAGPGGTIAGMCWVPLQILGCALTLFTRRSCGSRGRLVSGTIGGRRAWLAPQAGPTIQ